MKKFFSVLLLIIVTAGILGGCQRKTASNPDALKIGMTVPLQGKSAIYGEAVKAGVEIAVDEINQSGKTTIELMIIDDADQAKRAKAGYKQLKKWGMQIFLGSVTSESCLAAAQLAAEDGVFLLTPGASASEIPYAGDQIYQLVLCGQRQGALAAKWFAEKNLGSEGIGILYDAADCYSTDILHGFESEAQAISLKTALKVSIRSESEEDLRSAVQLCKDKNASAVFIPINVEDAAKVLSVAADLDYFPIFLGCDGVDGILSVMKFNKRLSDSLIFMSCYTGKTDSQHRYFREQYQQKCHGEIPSQFAALGYDAVYAVYEAAKNANITGETPVQDVCKKLQSQFNSMKFSGLTGDNLSWDTHGMINRDMRAMVISEGNYKLLKW